jgi:dTDP-D-glucose 4,6-dehydratase
MNIGNPHEMSVLGLAELVRDLTGSASPIVFVPRPEDDPTVRQPDVTLARSALGWEPQVGLEEGLERTIRWFRTARPGSRVAGAPPVGAAPGPTVPPPPRPVTSGSWAEPAAST